MGGFSDDIGSDDPKVGKVCVLRVTRAQPCIYRLMVVLIHARFVNGKPSRGARPAIFGWRWSARALYPPKHCRLLSQISGGSHTTHPTATTNNL